MKIIGIDPGTRYAGYGIIEIKNKKAILKAAGAWNLKPNLPLAARLGNLSLEFKRVLSVFEPTCLCLEEAFVAQNIKSALYLGHARGVILSEAHLHGLEITEISATIVKKIIANNGRATKSAVAKIISSLLKVNMDDLPHDATDATAIAYADYLKRCNSQLYNLSVERSHHKTKLSFAIEKNNKKN